MSKSNDSSFSDRTLLLCTRLGFVLVGLLIGSGCSNCGEEPQPKEPKESERDVEEPETTDDPLEEASEAAEEAAVKIAVNVADEARYLAGEMQAAEQPDPKPTPPPKPTTSKKPSGTIDKEALDAVFNRHSNETRDCYERRLKTNPALAGRVYLTLTIARDGSVSRAHASGDTLNDPEVVDCIEAISQEWSFPSPDGGSAKVRKPLSFSPKR